MKYFAHLNTAVQVLQGYKGQQPFGIYLRDFFRQDKKYGSKDRRNIGHLCYCYFRTGKALPQLSVEERVVAGLFLCSSTSNEILAQLKPAWNEQTQWPVEEKCVLIHTEYTKPPATCSPLAIFPWQEQLSAAIDPAAFAVSFLQQPHLFLRVRPGNEKIVAQKLKQAGITYTDRGHHCLALPNASKVDEVLVINKEAVVQDYSSQRIREFLAEVVNRQSAVSPAHEGQEQAETANEQPVISPSKAEEQSVIGHGSLGILRVWDCCAASGGKSILAYDVLKNIRLTVSDVRESIMANLRKRFAEAGIQQYQSFVADLSNPSSPLPITPSPDLIIADVPCSGSGTWGRTPEQLYYFDTAAIRRYSELQKKIIHRVVPTLKPGGYFLYITCSVFREENEEAVHYIEEQFGLSVIKMEVLKGYDQQADTMFAALLKKP